MNISIASNKQENTTHKLLSNKEKKKTSVSYQSYKRASTMSSMAVSTVGFKGGLGSSFNGGKDHAMLAKSVPNVVRVGKAVRAQPVMKNVNEGKGLFAPLVVVTRQIVGKKRFNQLRGKAIALHSQVINEFCKAIGADGKQRQGLIRLAKKNGERLGFLA
ncbi:Protein PROTON GRADIENT REGULATION 5 [Hibiscus syriacus]|uniref:Protein PROTON GRADIENT REGULATION 5 n=1 Tax=Hibiscus syriacus TaxID=106335 RepID=A0A6A2X5G1_HIBSY|nr:protein PROTON GRADIENT REGULATION 5, chloroplastic-like [Hibiscus syriacus]KAE8670413.1 Protein PROTON GRADIENT REGULATION 5 [Hibiscus syriacus]